MSYRHGRIGPAYVADLPAEKALVKGEPLPPGLRGWTEGESEKRRAFWRSLEEGDRVTIENKAEMLRVRSRWRFYCGNTYGQDGSIAMDQAHRGMRVSWPRYAWYKQPDGTYFVWVVQGVRWEPREVTPIETPTPPAYDPDDDLVPTRRS
jgi:hypothetical protein